MTTTASLNPEGVIRSGGVTQIAGNSKASPTIVTTVQPHGLTTADTVFFTASTASNPLLTASPQQPVIVLTPTTFSVPVDTSGGAAGTAGAYDYAILSIPTSGVGVPATVNCGRAHGLRVGDTVTIVASGSTPSLDGAQVVTAVPTALSYQVGAVTNVTGAGSTTAAHFTKTVYYSDVVDRLSKTGPGAVALTVVAGTAPLALAVDIQGSIDGGVSWYNIPYALSASATTFVVSQISLTGAGYYVYLLETGQPWELLRLKFSSATNLDIGGVTAHMLPAA